MFPFLKRVRPRLVQRIYLSGIIQFAIVVVGIIILARQSRRPTFVDETIRFALGTLEAESGTPAALRASVLRVSEQLHWSLAVYDQAGELLASSPNSDAAGSLPLGPLPSAEVEALPGGGWEGTTPLPLPGSRTGTLRYRLPPPPSPPEPGGLGTSALLVLIVVGISSWWTARSLAVPLAQLSATTKAFGAGDFSARVKMKRSDELGEVAGAFDEMAERIMKSIRAERELLANVSHELRTPLQRIHVAVELASEGDAATARESLGDIAEDLGELERIVDDVLTAARLSLQGVNVASAVPPLRTEALALDGLLEKAVARFRAAHPHRTLDLSGLTTLPVIVADPILLRRVVDNLLENSHKYTDDPALPIAVSSWRSPTGVVIEVRDLGIGIAPDDLERVFEPFFRADRSRTRATGGFGLGLALARRIVESHGGRLVLDSEVGLGTTARIELPTV